MSFNDGVEVLDSDSIDVFKEKYNALAELVGDLDVLNTGSSVSIVAALNALQIAVNNVVVGSFVLPNNTYFLGSSFGGGTTDILKVNTSNKIVFGTQIVSIDINGGTITSLSSAIPIAAGGTGGVNAPAARTALGLEIGTNIQAWDANLDQIAALSPVVSSFIIGTGSGVWGLTDVPGLKTSLGLVIGVNVQAYDVNLDQVATMSPVLGSFIIGTGTGTWGLTDSAGVKTSLGLLVGTNIQAWDANLDQIAALSPTADNFIVGNGSAWIQKTPTTARTSLGLGTLATQDSTNVSVTGGTISGVSLEAVPVGVFYPTFATTESTGFLLMQGGTIGDASSGANKRANADTANLFAFLWNNLTQSEAAVSGSRGASAVADFAAHKTITIPDMRGRLPLGKTASGTGSTLGGIGGALDHTHLVKGHYHGMGTGADLNITASGSHLHDIHRSNVAASSTGTDTSTLYKIQASTGTPASQTDSASHTHPSGNFFGNIGLVTGGQDGNTDVASGSSNPPYIVVNYIIRY